MPNSRLSPFTFPAGFHSWAVVGPRTTDVATTLPSLIHRRKVSKFTPCAAGWLGSSTCQGPTVDLACSRLAELSCVPHWAQTESGPVPAEPQNGQMPVALAGTNDDLN